MIVAKFAIISGATLARARVEGLTKEGSRRGRIRGGRRMCEMNMFGVVMNLYRILCLSSPSVLILIHPSVHRSALYFRVLQVGSWSAKI